MYGELPTIKLESGEEVQGVTFRNPNPPKTAVLRLPTPAEIIKRFSHQKSLQRSLGRGKTSTEDVPSQKHDADLFASIRLDKGAPFDEFESSNAIGKLTRAEFTERERAGEECRITVSTPFGDTVHHMGMPMFAAVFCYRRGHLKTQLLQNGVVELRYPVEPAVTLYDATVKNFEGYLESFTKADIPPHHKMVVVQQLLQAFDELEAELNPNF